MHKLIKVTKDVDEGLVLNKWLERRMVARNQNVLIAVTGGTGSGKSYGCHRIAELWYKKHFNKRYPVELNTCFSIGNLMNRLAEKDPKKMLKKGELLIFEEAGANFGSLDFQNKIAKIFTYVLQSFRSMNIGILFNLPVLSMLNKSARLLIHSHLITAGIDYKKNECKFKAYFRQINQQTGKVYEKYIRVKVNRRVRPVKRFVYNRPTEETVRVYEARKLTFVSDLNEEFALDLRNRDQDNMWKMARKPLTERQREVYDMAISGMKGREIAEELGVTAQAVSDYIKWIKRKGFKVEKVRKGLENQENQPLKPYVAANLT